MPKYFETKPCPAEDVAYETVANFFSTSLTLAEEIVVQKIGGSTAAIMNWVREKSFCVAPTLLSSLTARMFGYWMKTAQSDISVTKQFMAQLLACSAVGTFCHYIIEPNLEQNDPNVIALTRAMFEGMLAPYMARAGEYLINKYTVKNAEDEIDDLADTPIGNAWKYKGEKLPLESNHGLIASGLGMSVSAAATFSTNVILPKYTQVLAFACEYSFNIVPTLFSDGAAEIFGIMLGAPQSDATIGKKITTHLIVCSGVGAAHHFFVEPWLSAYADGQIHVIAASRALTQAVVAPIISKSLEFRLFGKKVEYTQSFEDFEAMDKQRLAAKSQGYNELFATEGEARKAFIEKEKLAAEDKAVSAFHKSFQEDESNKAFSKSSSCVIL